MIRRALRRWPLACLPLATVTACTLGDAADPLPVVEVFQEATCECCQGWVRHIEAAGFNVEVTAYENPFDLQAVKREQAIPPELAGCHTALVGGYLIEGHVSAQDIRWLLRERPGLKGLVVPRMPRGAPGMEGGDAEPYAVLALHPDGTTAIFARHGPAGDEGSPDGGVAPDPASAEVSSPAATTETATETVDPASARGVP